MNKKLKSKDSTPPKSFLRFFRWYCHPKLRDYIEGDLMEEYNERVETIGKGKADWKFVIDVLLLFRPGIIKPVEGYKNLNTYGMYKSYFKIGWRNLLKNKGYSFINIGGLATGMAAAMLIGLWIYDELEFNKYHTNYKSIARVMRNLNMNGETLSTSILPNALGDELRTKYGNHFDHVVMATLEGDHILSTLPDTDHGPETKLSLRGEFIEKAGPEMFTLNMLHGSRSGLNDPHSILISQSAAKALFGNDDPMGKLLKIYNSDRMVVKVTGIYEDLPHNSSFHDVKFYAPFDLAFSANEWMQDVNFTNDFLNIYVAIGDHTTFESASSQIRDAILNNVRENKGYAVVNPQLTLHPMKDWHLRSEWKNGVIAGGAIQTVWLFGIVGGFVLVLACINFMNLSTARSEKRAKEVGIRKASGSARMQLVSQFFSESFLVVGLARSCFYYRCCRRVNFIKLVQ
jgi:putative ABC transport system permease protein